MCLLQRCIRDNAPEARSICRQRVLGGIEVVFFIMWRHHTHGVKGGSQPEGQAHQTAHGDVQLSEAVP